MSNSRVRNRGRKLKPKARPKVRVNRNYGKHVARDVTAAEFDALKHIVACILVHYGDDETLLDVIEHARQQACENRKLSAADRLAYRRVFAFFQRMADRKPIHFGSGL